MTQWPVGCVIWRSRQPREWLASVPIPIGSRFFGSRKPLIIW
jgi:hypothetical protein